ncbi:Rha family transcriptional regulator [Paraburkholderia tuberum]|uniref:Phage regulatory protein Rha (Phage_pRha) n=1 Tax=Paraburkholderia tuberum TaxID=157910 RepID=A0A1H1JS44_9BURK|nr:Rha family transcriptional regulator [Paraburkholderia tuberum]SDR52806.1 Phage regulatory protein Rha (Phage_pRha) [Paraburkholderia tuberum]
MNNITNSAAPTMSSREIAELVESRHDKVKQSIERLAERGVIQLPPMGEVKNHLGQTVAEYRICKRDSYVIVAQLSPEFTARLVDRWQELENSVAVPAVAASKLAGAIAIAECFTRLLKPSASCQMAMLAHIAKDYGIEPTFLPAYAIDAAPDATGGSSMLTKPLTELLIEHGIKIRPRTYNPLLADAGFLAERTRKSTSSHAIDGIKKFWVVTDEGLRFGKNVTHPNCPRETQPHWYVERFAEMHSIVSARLQGGGE